MNSYSQEEVSQEAGNEMQSGADGGQGDELTSSFPESQEAGDDMQSGAGGSKKIRKSKHTRRHKTKGKYNKLHSRRKYRNTYKHKRRGRKQKHHTKRRKYRK